MLDCGCVSGLLSASCKIDEGEPPPKGYKCECESTLGNCHGSAKKCKSENEPGCSGCAGIECCDGNCKGYEGNEQGVIGNCELV